MTPPHVGESSHVRLEMMQGRALGGGEGGVVVSYRLPTRKDSVVRWTFCAYVILHNGAGGKRVELTEGSKKYHVVCADHFCGSNQVQKLSSLAVAVINEAVRALT